jgi:hypothetical protein
VAQPGEPLHLRVPHEGEEATALHVDQRVGGPLHQKDRAGDALKPRRHIEHGRLHGLQVPRRLGEVQEQLTGIVRGQLPWGAGSGVAARILVRSRKPGPNVDTFRAGKVEIRCDRAQPVQFDGDTVEPTNRLTLEIDPSSSPWPSPNTTRTRRQQPGTTEHRHRRPG